MLPNYPGPAQPGPTVTQAMPKYAPVHVRRPRPHRLGDHADPLVEHPDKYEDPNAYDTSQEADDAADRTYGRVNTELQVTTPDGRTVRVFGGAPSRSPQVGAIVIDHERCPAP